MPIYFTSYEGSQQPSKNAVKATVSEFLQKIKHNSKFINGYTFYIIDNYNDLRPKSIFTSELKNHSEKYKYTGGASLCPELNSGEKEIVIKTEELDVPRKWFYNSKPTAYVEQATMHEIGHMFDNYYGQKDNKLLKQVVQIGNNTKLDNYSPTQEKIIDKYYKNKDLSDSEEFKLAWKKDLEAYYANVGFLERYSFKNYYSAFDIDITDGINSEEMEKADTLRSEDFAELFGFAFGKDNGNKDRMLKILPRTYSIVKNYIKKHLGVQF